MNDDDFKLVIDQSCSCELLLLPRRGTYNLDPFIKSGDPSILAKKLAKDDTSPIYIGGKWGSDVVAGQWRKDIEAPFGSFNFSIKSTVDTDNKPIDYISRVSPGDLVFIFMDNQKVWREDTLLSGTLITIGIVDRISRAIVVDGEGAEHDGFNLSGRDLGAVFTDTATVFDQAFAVVEQQFYTEAYFQQLADKQSSGQSPLENVLQIIDIIFNADNTSSVLVDAQWRFQVSKNGGDAKPTPLISLFNITDFTQSVMFGYTLPDPFAFAQAGNVWTLMDGFANKCINEMFVDVRDGTEEEMKFIFRQAQVASSFVSPTDQSKQQAARTKVFNSRVFRVLQPNLEPGEVGEASPNNPTVALVMRQRPYDRDAFDALPQVDVHMAEVYERDLGYAHGTVSNFFRIRSPIMSPVEQELIYGIRVNVDSIYRFGLRRYEPETRYFFTDSNISSGYANGESSGVDFTDVFDYYIGLTSTWYAANEQMLEGSIQIRLRPDIRVGVRLRLYAAKGELLDYGLGSVPYMDFYVESVIHQYSAQPGGSRTMLTLVRGIAPDGNYLAANLKWSRKGSAIPASLNTFGKFNELGEFAPESEIANKIFNDLRNNQ